MRGFLAWCFSTGLAVACSSSSDETTKARTDAGSNDAASDAQDTGSDANAADTSSGDGSAESGPDAGTGVLEISKSAQSFTEAEEQLAVAPDGTIAIAWMGYAYTDPLVQVGYRFSTDGGVSFTPGVYLTLPNGLSAIDPAIAVDANGNFYLSVVGAHYPPGSAADSHVFVAKAVKGSSTFAPPVEVTDPAPVQFYDHPKIMLTKQGTVLVVFMQSDAFDSTTNLGIAARSSDGISWQRSTVVGSDPSASNLFWICEGNGILYATYLESTLFQYAVAVRTSQDDGVTWATTSTYASLPSELPAGLDPSCVANGDDVWVSYGTSTNQPADAKTLDPAVTLPVAHSTDRAATFATRVDALESAPGTLALHPVLIREPGGALDLAYLSGKVTKDPAGTLRFARAAVDSFAPSVSVDGPLVFQVDRTGYDWLGDYIGAVERAGSLYFAFPKNVDGFSHVWFAKTIAK